MKRLSAVMILGSSFLAACAARAAGYVFTNIADSTMAAPIGTFTGFGVPSISGDRVAFKASFLRGSGIFAGDGGPLVTIAKSGDPAPFISFNGFGDPTISGDSVAFYGVGSGPHQEQGGRGVFVGSGGALTTIAKSGDLAPVGTFESFDQNAAISGGNVAFSAMYAGGAGIFTGNGASLTPVVRTGDPAPLGTFYGFHDLAISGNTVVFNGLYVADSTELEPPHGTGVFVSSGGSLATIATTGDPAPLGNFLDAVTPSSGGGKIAFSGDYDDKLGAIFSTAGGPLTKIAEFGGTMQPPGAFWAIDSPSASSDGVAFWGYSPSPDGNWAGPAQIGIFVGSGGPLNTVIHTGDSLFGSAVTFFGSSIRFGRFGFDPDGSGDVAFAYELMDGRFGIAMATPVPEPTSRALACLAFAVSTAARFAGRHSRRAGADFFVSFSATTGQGGIAGVGISPSDDFWTTGNSVHAGLMLFRTVPEPPTFVSALSCMCILAHARMRGGFRDREEGNS